MRDALVRRKFAEKGVAMVELAIAVPFLIPFCLAIYDVGNLIRTQFVMGQLSREVARLGATMPYLEPGRYQLTRVPLTNSWNCNGPGSDELNPGPPCIAGLNQRKLLWDGEKMFMMLPVLSELKSDYAFISTEGIPDATGTKLMAVHAVIGAQYGGLFYPFAGQWIRVSSTGPYL